jgi:hypothetical protein
MDLFKIIVFLVLKTPYFILTNALMNAPLYFIPLLLNKNVFLALINVKIALVLLIINVSLVITKHFFLITNAIKIAPLDSLKIYLISSAKNAIGSASKKKIRRFFKKK